MSLFLFFAIKELNVGGREIKFSLYLDSIEGIYSSQYVENNRLIPFHQFFVGLPPGGYIDVNVKKSGVKFLQQQFPSLPYWAKDERGSFNSSNSNGEIKIEYGTMRGLRIAKIMYFPYRVEGNKIRFPQYSDFTITIKGNIKYGSAETHSSWDRFLRKTLINYNQAVRFQRIEEEVALSQYDRSKRWIKVECNKKGIYSITGEDLQRTGWDIDSIDPQKLALFTVPVYSVNGPYPDSMREVSIVVEGEEDGKLDKKDRIIFFAPGVDLHTDTTGEIKNVYTGKEVFFLGYPYDNPARMKRITLTRADKVSGIDGWNFFEEDSTNPVESGTQWYWKKIIPGNSESFKFDLPEDLKIWGVEIKLYAESRDMPFVVKIEGEMVLSGETDASGTRNPVILRKEFEKGYSSKVITVENQDVADNIFVNSFKLLLKGDPVGDRFVFKTAGGSMKIDDKHIFLQIKDIFSPQRILNQEDVELENGMYAVFDRDKFYTPSISLFEPPQLPEQGVDMVIIVPDKFLGAGYRWKNLRSQTFNKVSLYTTSQIYDMVFGIEEPGAIKEFLMYINPVYVGLGADATYDMRGITDKDYKDKIPVFINGISSSFEPSVLEGSANADDKWFVDFENDEMYDAFIGRIPANTEEELAITIERMKDYEEQSLENWMNRIILIADDEYKDGEKTDFGIASYVGDLEKLVQVFPDGMEYRKVYSMFYPLVGNNEKPDARNEVIEALSEGGVIGVYYGHGNNEQLAHEKILFLSDVPLIANGLKSPFFIFGTCGAAWYDRITKSSLVEDLMLNRNGGIIGGIGAPKGTFQNGNVGLVDNIVDYLIDDSLKRAGDAFIYGCNTSGEKGYVLIGDPAMSLKLPSQGDLDFNLGYTDTIKEGKKNHLYIDNKNNSEIDALVKFYASKEIKNYTTVMSNNTEYEFNIVFETGIYNTMSEKIPENAEDTIDFIPPVGIKKGDLAHISILYNRDGTMFINQINRLVYDTSAIKENDKKGPEVELYINGVRITDGMKVPEEFLLKGVVYDESGVLLMKSGTKESGFYTGTYENWTPLTSFFTESKDNRVTFEVPLKMKGDSLVVIIYDNLLNATMLSYELNPVSETKIDISNCLVWPNPVDRDYLYFTFNLSDNALYSIDIYTIAGRHIKRIESKVGHFGFNKERWDLKDKNGKVVDNGPYFYIVRVQSGEQEVKYRGKFLVWR